MESLRGLVTALRTLTVIPVPGREAKDLASSLPWFPLVGLMLGAIVAGVAWGAWALLGCQYPQLAAFAALAAGTVLTRGLHLDGLSDWADSFGSIRDRERMLQIMKDSRVGVFGVLAVGLILIGKFSALQALVGADAARAVVVSFVVARTMQVEIASSLPYARVQGTAAPFVSGAGWAHRLIAVAAGLALSCLVWRSGGPMCFLVGWAVCQAFRMWCKVRLGGVTGDLIGACSELVEMSSLFAAVVVLQRGIAML